MSEARVRMPHLLLMALVFAAAGYGEVAVGDEKVPRDAPTLQEVLETTKPGTRLRVMRADGRILEGGLVEAHQLTLFEPVEEGRYTVEWEDVDTLWELRVSKARGQKIGGIFGLALGVFVGAYVGLGLSGLCFEGGCDDSPKAAPIVSGAFLGGLVGGCAGLLIGNAVSEGTPEWIRRYPVSAEGH